MKCKIHGRTQFKNGKCIKCQELKRGKYRIYKRDKKYYFNRDKKPLESDYFMKPYLNILSKRDKKSIKIGKITKTPGTYGIFVRNGDKLGECLYVGQSFNVSQRVIQHKKNLIIAENHIKGRKRWCKSKRLNTLIPSHKRKVEYKYYQIAFRYTLQDIKFVKLSSYDKKFWNSLTNWQQRVCLTFFEQYAMDIFSPKYNTFAARPTLLDEKWRRVNDEK